MEKSLLRQGHPHKPAFYLKEHDITNPSSHVAMLLWDSEESTWGPGKEDQKSLQNTLMFGVYFAHAACGHVLVHESWRMAWHLLMLSSSLSRYKRMNQLNVGFSNLRKSFVITNFIFCIPEMQCILFACIYRNRFNIPYPLLKKALGTPVVLWRILEVSIPSSYYYC